MTMNSRIGFVVVTVGLLTHDVMDACCVRPAICNKGYVITATVTRDDRSIINGIPKQMIGLSDVKVHKNSTAMDNLVMNGFGLCADMPVSPGSRYIFAGNDVQTSPEVTVLAIHVWHTFYERVDNVDNVDSVIESELNACGTKRNADTKKMQNKVRSFIKAALYGNDW